MRCEAMRCGGRGGGRGGGGGKGDFPLILYAAHTNLVIIKRWQAPLASLRLQLDFAAELVSAFCSFDLLH